MLSLQYEDAPTAHPFLKWAGGKRQLLARLQARMPQRIGRYFEPFVGGGALFFALNPDDAVLSDGNVRLVRTYWAIRNSVEDVIARLRNYPHDKDFFMRLRVMDIDACPDAEVAAWLIYLNRTAFNGLYRVNSRGGFNVPFGRYKNPTICDADNLRACSRALRHARILHKDFEAAVADARTGDFVYLDPPYVPLNATSDFTSYTQEGFGDADQVRLRDVALRLKASGVHVLLSNSGAPRVRELYAHGFEIEEVAATRSINSVAKRRGAVTEFLIR